jgi:hypothetical protein
MYVCMYVRDCVHGKNAYTSVSDFVCMYFFKYTCFCIRVHIHIHAHAQNKYTRGDHDHCILSYGHIHTYIHTYMYTYIRSSHGTCSPVLNLSLLTGQKKSHSGQKLGLDLRHTHIQRSYIYIHTCTHTHFSHTRTHPHRCHLMLPKFAPLRWTATRSSSHTHTKIIHLYTHVHTHTFTQVSPDAAKVCSTPLDGDQIFVTSIERVNTTDLRRRASHRHMLQHNYNKASSIDIMHDTRTYKHFEGHAQASQRRLLQHEHTNMSSGYTSSHTHVEMPQHGHTNMSSSHPGMLYTSSQEYIKQLQHGYSNMSSNHADMMYTSTHTHVEMPQHGHHHTSSSHADMMHTSSHKYAKQLQHGGHNHTSSSVRNNMSSAHPHTMYTTAHNNHHGELLPNTYIHEQSSQQHVLQQKHSNASSTHTGTTHITNTFVNTERGESHVRSSSTGQNTEDGQITEHDILKIIWEVTRGGRQTDRRQEIVAGDVTYFRVTMQLLGSPGMPDGT